MIEGVDVQKAYWHREAEAAIALVICFSLDLNPRRGWLLCQLFLAET